MNEPRCYQYRVQIWVTKRDYAGDDSRRERRMLESVTVESSSPMSKVQVLDRACQVIQKVIP